MPIALDLAVGGVVRDQLTNKLLQQVRCTMRSLINFRTLLLILAVVVLGGCSGGGGGGGSSAPAAPTGSSNWDSMKWDQDNWS